jgi:hypothetical protein
VDSHSDFFVVLWKLYVQSSTKLLEEKQEIGSIILFIEFIASSSLTARVFPI